MASECQNFPPQLLFNWSNDENEYVEIVLDPENLVTVNMDPKQQDEIKLDANSIEEVPKTESKKKVTFAETTKTICYDPKRRISRKWWKLSSTAKKRIFWTIVVIGLIGLIAEAVINRYYASE